MSKIEKGTFLGSEAPSGNLLYGTKTSKEVQAEQTTYKEKMLNEEAVQNTK